MDGGRVCHACTAKLGDSDRFCPGCGMPQDPKKGRAESGLNANKFKPSPSAAPAPAPAAGNNNVVGKYEYHKPGSGGDKSIKYLTLNANGTAIFYEKGETSMESFEINGRGSWRIEGEGSGETVMISFPEIKKDNKLKRQVLVPGMGASHVTVDDGLDIPVATLVNAPGHGVHKWRKSN
uniref:Zinc-ribbon domain-containing protein n=1 Tax=Paramoeba aestuarina TaxID=180227 RepID=A0A7S4KY35_9EUKA|mmetsp:Transcript_27751/g.43069  ORF Transcript_27751/g.43069 Transcript_27751/m.43069 type:complete len:179 (+) Transcript_27751:55-591(+)|eukprot:CAMPEP_0201531096 /NCGR_PEP_ID=MMETSP0161_2-20130828/46582_1 /ASSEMBLY_ACC=CAM_ASM_000251 /TAXON_ID=180227 /ORGANISM="Neoparamoeba aestuarina, Strain SoJaBio B1-5/56/2" /LENGTH=178 /DNA_ID=CAMNT_0047933779 /DNA_START=62 /DNA_END=598 /DNA_ORIENTATION=-